MKMPKGPLLVSKPRPKRVTLADVAAKAGVSVATASVAMTGRPSGNCRVSPAVADRIRHAARLLNYRPNLQARNLSTQRTHTVALLIKRAAWHVAMPYVSVAQRVLRENGYLEYCTLYPDNRLDSERDNLDLCVQRRVEGIIAMPLIDLQGRANVEMFNQVYREEGIAVMHLGLSLPGCAAPSVVTDEAEGVLRAVRLLHAMGHRRIAHVAIKGYENADPLNPFRVAHLRYQGYQRAMAELGLGEEVVLDEAPVKDIEGLFDSAIPLAQKLLKLPAAPTAVITFSDHTAAGIMRGLADAGVKVPEQVSVLGVGGQPFARMLRPSLTTLAPQFEAMAELATRTLLRMIEGGGEASAQSAALPPVLEPGQSLRAIKDD
jgi:LacI family transcriptional regulator